MRTSFHKPPLRTVLKRIAKTITAISGDTNIILDNPSVIFVVFRDGIIPFVLASITQNTILIAIKRIAYIILFSLLQYELNYFHTILYRNITSIIHSQYFIGATPLDKKFHPPNSTQHQNSYQHQVSHTTTKMLYLFHLIQLIS